jgi:glycosyltransferase involved in cell wall biosynthesis
MIWVKPVPDGPGMMPYTNEHSEPERIFILYSAVNDRTISTSLGMPEYSYYFVCKGFADVLKDLGEVRICHDPSNEVDNLYDEALTRGQTCLFFCFSPPNKMIRNLRCPTIVVFAWEFDSIPQASLGMTGSQDWAVALQETGQAISLSSHSRDVVKKTLGETFPISAIPVPVPISEETLKKEKARKPFEVKGIVIDSSRYVMGAENIEAMNPAQAFPMAPWDGNPIAVSFRRDANIMPSLCGFYEPEVWGAWSCLSNAWVLLPNMVSGEITLDLTFKAYGANIGRTITVSIGHQKQRLFVDSHFNVKRLYFTISERSNVLMFSDLDARSIPGQPDPRSMAIGLIDAMLTRTNQIRSDEEITSKEAKPQTLKIDGVLYSSVLNPKCGRKNWRDMITAFCWAFRENPDATLLIKVSSQHHSEYFSELHELFAQLQPFRCRILVVHGFLSSNAYQALVSSTDFYVNTSRAEGQCLPLMEFMAQGKPAIAPCHTSLLDYVNDDANFLVGSSEELTVWPHDPKEKYTATRQRIDWSSLVAAYKESYEVVRSHPERYKKMSGCAKHRIAGFASRDQVRQKLNLFIKELS